MAELAVAALVGSAVAAGGAAIVGSMGQQQAAADTIAGGNLASQGALEEARSAYQSYYYKASQERLLAQEDRASAQADMRNTQQKVSLTQSALRARAAADGGGTDPTVVALSDQIAKQGSIAALTDMFKGEDSARGRLDQARGYEMTGDAALRGGDYKSAALQFEAQSKARALRTQSYATLLGGASDMLGKFGRAGSGGKGGYG